MVFGQQLWDLAISEFSTIDSSLLIIFEVLMSLAGSSNH
jgi:hypothetical protein